MPLTEFPEPPQSPPLREIFSYPFPLFRQNRVHYIKKPYKNQGFLWKFMEYCKYLKDFLSIQDQVKDCGINEDYDLESKGE